MGSEVLLAIASPMLADTLSAFIDDQDDLEVVGVVEDAQRGLEAAERLKPDVVILDMKLPPIGGCEFARRAVTEGCDGGFIFLADDESTASVKAVLAVGGCTAFVRMEDHGSELLRAVRSVIDGRSYVSAGATHALIRIAANGDSAQAANLLTPREREVLGYIAEGLSSREIAEKLELSTRTIESHRSNLMDKLGVHKVQQLVRYAIREGIVPP